jgi:hypothetical protein
MNKTLSSAELVALWRNGGEQENPAGPLFAAGDYAEADITTSDCISTCGTACSGSRTRYCC